MTLFACRTCRQAVIKTVAMAGVLMLSACAMGPDYQRPSVDVGDAYKELGSGQQGTGMVGASTAQMQGWVPAQPGDAVLRADWWQLFNDPVLSELMGTLQSDNLNIVQAEAQYRQAQAMLQSARSGFFPTVGVNAAGTRSGSGRNASSNGNVGGNNPSNQFSLSGSVSWEPDLWGRVRRSVEASGASLQASQADLATIRLSMQSALAQTYFQLRVMDAEKQLLQQTVAAYERSLTMTQNRYGAGVVAQADVESARTQLENGRTQLLALDWQRAQLEHAIAVLLGQAPSRFTLAAADLQAQVPVVPVGLPSELVQRRPEVAAAERRTAEANARIGVAQTAWFPSLTLSAQGGYRASEWAQWLSAPASFWSLGPALALAIFDGGAREAQLEDARAAYDAQAAAYRQTVLTALQEVEDYLVQLNVLGQEQVTQGRALASARESLRLTRNQYDAGLIDYLSVVQVETTALNTERSALSLVSDRLQTSVQLIAALGGGWDAAQLETAEDQNRAEAADTDAASNG